MLQLDGFPTGDGVKVKISNTYYTVLISVLIPLQDFLFVMARKTKRLPVTLFDLDSEV